MVDGEPDPYGTYSIDGVPRSGARISTRYLNPCGGMLGTALPTGQTTTELAVDDELHTVSIVDATNVTVFLHAGALGLDGTELPAAIESNPELLSRLERIRAAACVELGLVNDSEQAAFECPTMPFIAVVAPPQGYTTSVDNQITPEDIDITARMVSTGRPHHAYATTGAMCLAAATRISGTIPAEAAQRTGDEVRIGHPKGLIRIDVDMDNDEPSVQSVSIDRTARLLMCRTAFARNRLE